MLHAYHGLSNRLRAVAAAADFAVKANRSLEIIWETDLHVNCPFEELFTFSIGIPVKVRSSFDPALLDSGDYDVYDYMGKDKNKWIDHATPRNIYVKSAYRLNRLGWDVREENRYMRKLKPMASARQLIKNTLSKLQPEFVGVHVRNLNPKVEIPNLPDSEYQPDSWKVLKEFRAASNVTTFSVKLNKISSQRRSKPKFFVAADDPKLLEHLQANVQSEVFWLERSSCIERTCSCLKYAIADLWILGHANEIIGSYWSSFSEVAGSLADLEVQYSGQDF